MSSRIIISEKLMEKFQNVNYTEQAWSDITINNTDDLIQSILSKIKLYNNKLNVLSIEVGETNDNRSFHTSHILDDRNGVIAYVFFISPGSVARNMFLAQQTYGSTFGSFCLKSISNNLFNKPIYIINTNENKLQNSKKTTIKGAKTIGFHYIDVFNNESFDLYRDIQAYNNELIDLGDSTNHWFTINETAKIVKFHTGKNELKDATSDRYEFLARQFPAIQLAYSSNYKYDINEVESNSNKDIVDSFIKYTKKLYEL